MINRVQFRNFKVLRQVEVDLERLTVFVGANASGKTSLLEGLHCVADYCGLDRADTKAFATTFWGFRSSGVSGDFGVMACGEDCVVSLAVDPTDFGLTKGQGSSFVGHSFREEGIKHELEVNRVGDLAVERAKPFAPVAFLRLDVKSLVAPSYSDEPTPRMEPDGHGLPSVLAYLAANRPNDYADLLLALLRVIPIVQAMRFPRAAVVRPVSEIITVDGKPYTHQGEKTYWGNSIEFDVVGGRSIPASRVSEGTLLVLGILTAVLGPARPRLLLLDDIDRALHPKAQKDLVALLRKLMEANPELQIIATSHSPYLLDHLRPEEVRLTTLCEDGSAACARLDQHPEFEKWKDEMSPGEFWSTVGEKWVAEVGPEVGKEKQG